MRGGSEGFAAHYAEMTRLARTVDQTSSDLLRRAGLGAKVMTNSDLVESAILAPVTFAKAEAAVVLATTGPSGLTVEGGTLKIDAFLLRVTVGAYQDADALQHAAMKAFDYTTGFQLGLAAPALALAGAAAYASASPEQRTAMTAALQQWAAKHPGALEHVIDGGGGLLDGLGVWEKVLTAPSTAPVSTRGACSGSARSTPPSTPPPRTSPASTRTASHTSSALESVNRIDAQQPPRNVQDLMERLDETNAVKTEGYVRVQTINVDGVKKYIAYIPGTDDMGTKPFGSDSTIRDMGANLKLVGGENTAYGRGIVEAINKATAGDPNAHVMMVGHSQGGMTAMKLAAMGAGGTGAHSPSTTSSPPARPTPKFRTCRTAPTHCHWRTTATPSPSPTANPTPTPSTAPPSGSTAPARRSPTTTPSPTTSTGRRSRQGRGGPPGRLNRNLGEVPALVPDRRPGTHRLCRDHAGDTMNPMRLTRGFRAAHTVTASVTVAVCFALAVTACAPGDAGNRDAPGEKQKVGCGDCTSETAALKEQIAQIRGITKLSYLEYVPASRSD